MIGGKVKYERWSIKLLQLSTFFCVLMSFVVNDFAVAAMLHCNCALVDEKSYDKQMISCHEDPQSHENDVIEGRYVETSPDEKDLIGCDKCERHCQLPGQASIVSDETTAAYFHQALLRFLEPQLPQSAFTLGIDYPPKIKL
tara:strand:+ start:203 stop:628 length:426 start_codon:yes stop_codon:yes gene_type:complete